MKGDALDVPGISERTVRRWFAGERVEDDVRPRVLDAFVDSWLPPPEGEPELRRPHALLRALARELAAQWDAQVSACQSFTTATVSADLATLPAARIFALDLGLRYGVARRTLAADGVMLPAHPLDAGVFRDTLDRLRGVAGGLSVARLAAATDVDATTIERWRAGETLPSVVALARLARALAPDGGGGSDVLLELRLSVAAAHVAVRLGALWGDFYAAQVFAMFHGTADEVFARVAAQGVAEPFVTDVVLRGARSRVGASIARDLSTGLDEWGHLVADLAVLPGVWTERIQRWAMSLFRPPEEVGRQVEGTLAELRARDLKFSREFVEEVAEFAHRKDWTFEGYKVESFDPDLTIQVPLPAEEAACNWLARAQGFADSGDLDRAIACARTAIERAPHIAYAHFLLGAYLGDVVRLVPEHPRRGEIAVEAMNECRVAFRLDPSEAIALNEVGIILGNLRRHDEAEEVFAQAAGPCAEVVHHHLCRATNLLALGEYARATVSFERVLRLKPDHVRAHAHLAVLYERAGKRRLANERAAVVRQAGAEDPRATPILWMNPFLGLPLEPAVDA